MSTTENHGGAGPTTALPQQGATKTGNRALDPDRQHHLRRPDGRRHFSVARVPKPATPPQPIAARLADGDTHVLNASAREADDD
jgi:hypothetical protein